MNGTAPHSSQTAADQATDHSRLWAALSALLFLPAALVTWVLTLASERASRCMTYGEQCGSSMPEWLFDWSVGLGCLAFAAALAAPMVRVRQAALAVQLLAECTALVVILSNA
ncbi:hypothetical protein [Streptomyces sp. NPDC050485]|uniref:hypothetical protein n=1 Tax=Streptomyces sp. NPDC050485 TaxID=3365617 RepID=UPI0037A0EF9A